MTEKITPERVKELLEAATPGPWNLSADRLWITQTSHVTRDVWTIPRTEEDMGLIAAAPDLACAYLRTDTEREAAQTREQQHFKARVDAERKALDLAREMDFARNSLRFVLRTLDADKRLITDRDHELLEQVRMAYEGVCKALGLEVVI